ncbi:hypothetical protein EKO27_g4126 [Xylaria grammica]|uniref:Uncharacterized protein n=1 Tax=Xylaria grammica TaxID=363999 RepID=A0A439D996_9PEZI|nr:hypothetical protein EKO27_g4126 [Xylaria grammica]
MPYLIESIEWRLFQELGRLLKARLRRGPPSEDIGRPLQAELFEVELRQAFMVYDVSEKLNQNKYDEFQESLKRLCLLLNDLARPPIVDGGPVAHAYPALDALAKHLELFPGQVDLATGFDDPLFQLPETEDELNAPMSSIPDICEDLRQQMGQGKSLTLLVKEYGLFGTWGAPIGPVKGMSSKESLHQLIMEGAFKPLDFNTLLSGAPPAKFSTRAKRELAVKLGFCLMDFFDADLASKQIYFLNYSNSRPRKEPPYLAFNSKPPPSSDPYNFGMGHPALLSFAKLLLELDFGEVIDLSISPHNSKNSEAYVKLMVIVERLEQERSDSTATDSLNRWFAELANMNAVVRVKPGERDSGSPHIRIAILDTGIENQCLNGIKEYEDFVDRRNESPLDSNGHGTNIFSLLRKVCDDADFFIGRVWEGTKATPDTPLLMEEAIDYARKVWKVDIIVLSSGFQTAKKSVGEAIERANMARILTFASPSNYGNMGDLYYPGRLYGHGKVICLFSTNSMVKSSTTKTFNPSPLDTAAHRTFAILGEDIFLENLREPLNGTSYSTAIGAGIAARILDFSRHPRFRDKLENIDDLWKVEGMLAVFGRMAKRTDNGYRCMAPWVICPRAEEGMERREARERQQSAVVDVLRNALKDIDRA